MSRTPRTAPSIATAASRSCSSVCPPCPSRPPISPFDPGAAGMLRAIVHRELVIGLAAQHHRHLANRGISNDHGALYPAAAENACGGFELRGAAASQNVRCRHARPASHAGGKPEAGNAAAGPRWQGLSALRPRSDAGAMAATLWIDDLATGRRRQKNTIRTTCSRRARGFSKLRLKVLLGL